VRGGGRRGGGSGSGSGRAALLVWTRIKGGMVVGLVDEGRGRAGNGGRGEFFRGGIWMCFWINEWWDLWITVDGLGGDGKEEGCFLHETRIQFSVCKMSCQKRSIIFFEKGY